MRCFYTYSEFKSEYRAKQGFVYAHVPNSPGRRFALPFYLGFKPEWRNRYSARWLRSSLMSFSPNIVYAFVCSMPCLEFSYWIAKKAKVPLAVHVADDIINEDNVEPIVREIMGYAKIRIAIYKIMQKKYEEIFGLKFSVFHNFARQEMMGECKNSLEKSFNPENPFLIRFIGSYFPQLHEDAIDDIIAVTDKLKERGIALKFEFWGNEFPSGSILARWKNCHAVHLGTFKEEDKCKLHWDADLLLVPASFNEKSRKYYQYSFPTKLTECLLSATPTLVYSPPKMGASHFCKENDVGVLLLVKSKDKLEKLIINILKNYSLFSKKAWKDSQKIGNKFSLNRIRKEFQRELMKCVSSN